jgi:hypothetical protein
MKITVCCSLAFADEAIEVKKSLEGLGFDVYIPITILTCREEGIKDIKGWIKGLVAEDPVEFDKLKKERMDLHCKQVEGADAILVLNYDKDGKKNYIGGNALLEMGLAFWLKKPIYLLNDMPEAIDYIEEIRGMMPIVIHGNLNLIK